MFDSISKDDLIMAFFPCVRFEDNILLFLRGDAYQYKQKSYSDERKLECAMQIEQERTDLYKLITKLVIVVYRKGLKMIIENPYSVQHYLRNYWPLKPKIVDTDRRREGDYYKKPTQFWFINCEPEQNFLFEPIEATPNLVVSKYKVSDLNLNRTVARSIIHPQYAKRFIKTYLVDEEVMR